MKKAFFAFIISLLVIPQFVLAEEMDTGDHTGSCNSSDYPAPSLSATNASYGILLEWDMIDNEDFAGYKIVISKNDSTPEYPANGYLKYLTSASSTSWAINNSSAYINGDFGSYLEEDENYYFSITALYNCSGTQVRVPGNVLEMTYQSNSAGNGDDDSDEGDNLECTYMADLDITETDINNVTSNSAKIKWHSASGAEGNYRYATSEDTLDDLPWLTRGVQNSVQTTGRYGTSQTTLVGLEEDTKYYVEVRKLAANYYSGPVCGDSKIITFTTYGDSTDLPVPELTGVYDRGDMGTLIEWEEIDDPMFSGYKIVASKNDANPAYPANGYYKYITRPATTGLIINNETAYHNGDFGNYFVPGEEYHFSITALYNNGNVKIPSNTIKFAYVGPEHDTTPNVEPDPLVEMARKAEQLRNSELGDILDELAQLRNRVREQENEIKYLRGLVSDLSTLAQQVKDSLNQFITYGVDENTELLGEGERAAVIYSYKAAFDKLPETDDELADAIRIANGRWPSQTSETAEANAKIAFKKIYLRDPDMSNPNDNAAVTIMAYGLRQKAVNRNLDSERQGIKTFQYIYGHTPSTTEEWNIMQAITYSGATR